MECVYVWVWEGERGWDGRAYLCAGGIADAAAGLGSAERVIVDCSRLVEGFARMNDGARAIRLVHRRQSIVLCGLN